MRPKARPPFEGGGEGENESNVDIFEKKNTRDDPRVESPSQDPRVLREEACMIVHLKNGGTADCAIPPEALWLLYQVHEEAGNWLYTQVTVLIGGIPRILDLQAIDVRASIEAFILENERDTEPGVRTGSTMPSPSWPPCPMTPVPEF